MSKLHVPYEEISDHPEDFRVNYKFYSKDEGGRENIPHQGIRSDFWYECEHSMEGIFMIWPEFEDRNGELIKSGAVLNEGVARMWIFSNELRPYHQERIELGTIGYFMEGSRRTAKCEVIEIVGLLTNPVKFNYG